MIVGRKIPQLPDDAAEESPRGRSRSSRRHSDPKVASLAQSSKKEDIRAVRATVEQCSEELHLDEDIIDAKHHMVELQKNQQLPNDASNVLVSGIAKVVSHLDQNTAEHSVKLEQHADNRRAMGDDVRNLRSGNIRQTMTTRDDRQTLGNAVNHIRNDVQLQEGRLRSIHQSSMGRTPAPIAIEPGSASADNVNCDMTSQTGRNSGAPNSERANGPGDARLLIDGADAYRTHGGPMHVPMISNSKIIHPPIFDSPKSLNWKKDYMFRRDLHWYIGDPHLLSITGMNASTTLRRFTIQYVRESRDGPRRRTIPQFLLTLEEQYDACSRER